METFLYETFPFMLLNINEHQIEFIKIDEFYHEIFKRAKLFNIQ